ncbi:MFS transporter [Dyadobacter sp. NIV53]|uniref:MFS transporter n=1 Tax=Dyadobacter sp. NIV53 TaxID=2861765 RepID=UPI001C8863C4|nr:MFS transporter [Dyadobacter sp. NIV53]
MEKDVDIVGVYAERPSWQTIFVLSLGLLGSITAELILTGSAITIADELGFNKHMLGRAVTALTAFFTMLSGTNVARKINQGNVILTLLLLLILSSILISMGSNQIMSVIGRVLLGIVTGSFSLIFITVFRTLGSEKTITKSLSIVFPGLLLASGTVVMLGSVLEKMLGWKTSGLLIGIFVITSFFGLMVGPQDFKSKSQNSGPALIDLLAHRANKIATLVVVLLLGGQFAFILYLGPFVKAVADFHGYSSFAFLMTFVISNFLGGWLDPLILSNNPFLKLIVLPAALSCALLGMVLCDQILWLTYILIIFLGFFNGPFMIGWAKWLTQNFTSNGSFLLLAVIQLSIAFGAVGGWIFFEIGGVKAVLTCSGIVLLAVPLCLMILCSGSDLKKGSG